MAVTATNQVTKAKLVFQVENEEGEMRQTSPALFRILFRVWAMMRCMRG